MSSIKLFESKQIRTVWNEFDQKWYFSVQDVVQLLTETTDVKDYIKKMKKRDPVLNSKWGVGTTSIKDRNRLATIVTRLFPQGTKY